MLFRDAIPTLIFASTVVFLAPSSQPPQHPVKPAWTAYSHPPPTERIDINQATVNDLMRVPGMSVVWANRIVRFRPYRTKLDLLQHGVLSASAYERYKDFLVAHHGQ